MFETLGEKAEEKAMVQFLERFTDYPFLVKFKNSEYSIGEGEPTFTVNFKETIPLAELLKSTSLALGEAYMRGDLDIEGNLYEALDHFLGQMGKFSTNESALKKIMFSWLSRARLTAGASATLRSLARNSSVPAFRVVMVSEPAGWLA